MKLETVGSMGRYNALVGANEHFDDKKAKLLLGGEASFTPADFKMGTVAMISELGTPEKLLQILDGMEIKAQKLVINLSVNGGREESLGDILSHLPCAKEKTVKLCGSSKLPAKVCYVEMFALVGGGFCLSIGGKGEQ